MFAARRTRVPPGRAERRGRGRLGRGVPAADGRRAGAEYVHAHGFQFYYCIPLCQSYRTRTELRYSLYETPFKRLLFINGFMDPIRLEHVRLRVPARVA